MVKFYGVVAFREISTSNKIKSYDFHYRFKSCYQYSSVWKEKQVQNTEHLVSVKRGICLAMTDFGLST